VEDLFRAYWWLLFPLGWFIASGFQGWLNYRRHRDRLDMIKAYAAQGKEPPAELLASLNRVDDDDDDDDDRRDRRQRRRYYRRRWRHPGGWYPVVLFGVLAVGFGYAAWADIYGAGEAFVIVAFVTGALCLASLVSTLTTPRRD
jgi:hypothetical protein